MAMGQAYGELIRSNPDRLRAQMQTYAACEDADVRAVAQKGLRSGSSTSSSRPRASTPRPCPASSPRAC